MLSCSSCSCQDHPPTEWQGGRESSVYTCNAIQHILTYKLSIGQCRNDQLWLSTNDYTTYFLTDREWNWKPAFHCIIAILIHTLTAMNACLSACKRYSSWIDCFFGKYVLDVIIFNTAWPTVRYAIAEFKSVCTFSMAIQADHPFFKQWKHICWKMLYHGFQVWLNVFDIIPIGKCHKDVIGPVQRSIAKSISAILWAGCDQIQAMAQDSGVTLCGIIKNSLPPARIGEEIEQRSMVWTDITIITVGN